MAPTLASVKIEHHYSDASGNRALLTYEVSRLGHVVQVFGVPSIASFQWVYADIGGARDKWHESHRELWKAGYRPVPVAA